MDAAVAKIEQIGGPLALPSLCAGALLLSFLVLRPRGKQPPSLSEVIPFYNTIQYLTNVGKFMDRVT